MKTYSFILAILLSSSSLVLAQAEEETVVVTASRNEQNLSQVAVTTRVINANQVKKSSAENVAELLEEQPGIQLDRSVGGVGIVLQGLDPEYTLVLIDGQRVNGRVAGTIDLRRISLENVERIEIVKGASSSLYGSDAMGGVVNIITKEPAKEHSFSSDAHTSYGSLNAIDATAGVDISLGKFKTRAYGGYHRRDSFDLDTSDLSTDGSEFYSYNMGNRSKYRVNKKLAFNSRVEYKQNKQSSINESTTAAVYDQGNLFEEFQTQVSMKKDFRVSSLAMSSSYFYYRDQYLSDQRKDTENDSYEETIDQSGELNIKYTLAAFSDHIFTMGSDNLVEELNSDRLNNKKEYRYRLAGFIQDEWLYWEKFNATLVPGVRYDYDSQFSQAVSPKIAHRFDILDNLVSRVSYGWGFKVPDFKQLYLFFANPGVGYQVEGNANLEPERSQNVTADLEYMPLSWLTLNLGYFRNQLENLIATEIIQEGGASNLTRYSYVNVTRALTQGIESNIKFSFEFLTFSAGYIYTDAINQSTNQPLAGRPEHQAVLRLTVHPPKTGLTLSTSVRLTGRRAVNGNDDGIQVSEIIFTSPYALVDARLDYNLNALLESNYDITAFIRAENIANEGHATYLPLTPFSVYGGLDFRFPSISKKQQNKNNEEAENANRTNE